MTSLEDRWLGGRYGVRGRCLLAPNPGMMTLDGTNTWILREPGAAHSVVVDPGPIEDGHLDLVDAESGPVALILLTHHHYDHSEIAAELAARKHCQVRAFDPELCIGAPPLRDGEELEVDGLQLRAVHTPGHTADSMSFVVSQERALLSGDMILGRGTTVVAYPDGQLGPYLDSLDTMGEIAASEVMAVWPAHGPVLANAAGVIDFYRSHRLDRLAQVESALAELGREAALDDSGEDTLPRQVVEIVYADVDESLWVPAELSVRAQLAYLVERDAG